MSSIHFIGGEKGGVGKSLFARILAQYLIDHEKPLVAYDSDKSHGSLLRYYADFAHAVTIEQPDSLDRALEGAADNPQLNVLVDLAAQTHRALMRWIEGAEVPELAEGLGIKLMYWHVMDASHDSATLLGRLCDELDPKIQLNVVLNEIRGDQFELLRETSALAKALERGAKTLTVPKLPDTTMQRIDSHGSSFWAAINQSDAKVSGLGLLERQRVKIWLQRIYAELTKLDVAA